MKREVPEGAIVKFRHERRIETITPNKFDSDTRLASRGGQTFAKVILPDGTEFEGSSLCRSDENYSKKLGRDISLGRALAYAEKKHPELFRVEGREVAHG